MFAIPSHLTLSVVFRMEGSAIVPVCWGLFSISLMESSGTMAFFCDSPKMFFFLLHYVISFLFFFNLIMDNVSHITIYLFFPSLHPIKLPIYLFSVSLSPGLADHDLISLPPSLFVCDNLIWLPPLTSPCVCFFFLWTLSCTRNSSFILYGIGTFFLFAHTLW